MSSPKDAVIATVGELKALTEEYGVFVIAENAGYPDWKSEQRQQVLAAIAKTRKELRHVEQALQRLEGAVGEMGRPGSALRIEQEYIPLEGWVLTLAGNYAMLLAQMGRYDRTRWTTRLSDYVRGVILKAKGGNASYTLGTVRNQLVDQAVNYR
jgi:hypothetical protein